MDEQAVRTSIDAQIKRREHRITALEAENKQELLASKRLQNEVTIVSLGHSIDTLIELQHILRVCDCYQTQEKKGASNEQAHNEAQTNTKAD